MKILALNRINSPLTNLGRIARLERAIFGTECFEMNNPWWNVGLDVINSPTADS